MDIQGKLVVVTGAGSGIGRGLTQQLIAKGATVAGVDYNEQGLLQTQQTIAETSSDSKVMFSSHVVDISNQSQVAALPELIQAQHPGRSIDIIINNAGIIQPFSPVSELPLQQMERIFNVNWWGVVYMIQAFVPHLKQSSAAKIVNISSMGGYMPFPGQVIYGASKAAVKLLTEGMMVELSDTNISMAVVYPGAVQTNITANAPDISDVTKQKVQKQDKAVGVTAQQAAGAIIKGIEKDKPRILVGSDSKVIDKLYRLMPVKTARLMSWLMKKFAGVDMEQVTNE